MTITRDATSGWCRPANAAEWTELLAGTGIPNPDQAWGYQDAASPLAPIVGSYTLVDTFSSNNYEAAVPGWSSKAVQMTPEGGAHSMGTTSDPPTTSSSTVLQLACLNSLPSATRVMMYLLGACLVVDTAGHIGLSDVSTSVFSFGTVPMGTAVHPIVMRYDTSVPSAKVDTDQETVNGPAVTLDASNSMFFGNAGFGIGGPDESILYGALWSSLLSDAAVAKIISLIKNGPTSSVPLVAFKPTFSVVAHAAPAGGKNNMLAQVSVGVLQTTTTSPPNAGQLLQGNGIHGMPTSELPAIVDVITNPGTTLAALQAGSAAIKMVAALEGYPWLLTDADPLKAALAYSGTDYTMALPGLFVELDNEQTLDPNDPFANHGGKCTLRVQADPTDRLGIDMHRRTDGAEGKLIASLNRNGSACSIPTKVGIRETTIPSVRVDNGSDFVAGDAWIGTECLVLNGPADSMLGFATRGKYAPWAATGTGFPRFAQHHRVANDSNGVQLNPLLTQQPRTWIGRQVSVRMHTVRADGTLNARGEALCVYTGYIAGISDDPETGFTSIELEHVLQSITDATIGRDMWSGTLVSGVYIATGRTFSFADNNGAGSGVANALTVVASGASGPNQINAGYYELEDIAVFLNVWLAAELVAGRVKGIYIWHSPLQTTSGFRTTVDWTIPGSVGVQCVWGMSLPSEVGVQLGWEGQGDSQLVAGAIEIHPSPAINNTQTTEISPLSPWRYSLKMQQGVGGYTYQVVVENERGTLFDQYSWLPSGVRPPASSGLQWGLFLIDEKWLVIGSKDPAQSQTTLTNVVWLPNLDNFQVPPTSIGRRADDASSGPIAIRQILVLVAPLGFILNSLAYSTGTPGYNHPTYDTLGYGFGLGIPGEMLGAPWETSIARLPGAQLPACVVVDKPMKLMDLLGSDLMLRRAFLCWRTGHLEMGQWTTPTAELATFALDETNKAEPADSLANQRSATVEDAGWVKNVVKIQYDRDITQLTQDTYTKNITLEDQRSVDDAGGDAQTLTINARNTFQQFAATGAGVEQLVANYLAMMPVLTGQPVRKSTRSTDLRYYEGPTVGDQVIVTDAFMRDPSTGQRGVTARPGVITRTRYNPGGPTAGSDAVTGMSGEVDILFVDQHRYGVFAPAAEIDNTYNDLGFTAGYKAATFEIVLVPHAYSETTEATDASYFKQGDRIAITVLDPNVPSLTGVAWSRNVISVTGNVLALDQALPGFSTNGLTQYRVTYDHFSQCHGLQVAKVFQAATATGRIERLGAAFEYASTPEQADPTDNGVADPAEFIAASSYADGAPLDVGSERALIRSLNALVDYKAARCSPAIFYNGFSGGFTNFIVLSISRLYFGTEQLSNSVLRYLTVSPLIYNTNAFNTLSVRITLARSLPAAVIGTTMAPVTSIPVQFNDVCDQATWDVAPLATVYAAPAKILNINKDINGYAYLVVETTGAVFAGLAQCQESRRIITTQNDALQQIKSGVFTLT